jgi:hypothetical protein
LLCDSFDEAAVGFAGAGRADDEPATTSVGTRPLQVQFAK